MSMLGNPVTLVKYVVRQILSLLISLHAVSLIDEPLFWLMDMRQKGREIDLSEVKRVLVVRLDGIGDVVMTTPFLRELRQLLPDAWITLVVKPQVYNLVELCPYVNEVLTYNWCTHIPLWPLLWYWQALRLTWKHLWKRKFDLAILPRWDVDSYDGTFLAYFSGAPWRLGYSENVNVRKRHLNKNFDCLLTHTLQGSDLKHEVERNLDVIRFLGGKVEDGQLELWLGRDDEIFAESFLREHGVNPDDLLVALAPGAGAPKRLWPIDRFTKIGLWLQKEYGARLLVIGGLEEDSLGEKLEQALGSCVVNAVGQTTLRQTAALLKYCRLFVGNDAGPMHMAVAVSVPVVELSCYPEHGSPWSTNLPLRFGPWVVNHVVLQPKTSQPPCLGECTAGRPHCILGITVEQVKQVVAKYLNQDYPTTERLKQSTIDYEDN